MSIFNKIDQAFHAVDGKINQAVHVVDGKLHEAVHAVEGAGNSAIHHVEGAATNAVHKVEGEANKAVHAVESEVQEALNSVKHAEEQAISAISKELPAHLKALANKLEEGISAKGIKLMHSIVLAAANKMDKAPKELALALNEIELQLTIGPVTVAISRIYSRSVEILAVLAKYMNSPPAWNQESILGFVMALEPNNITVAADVEIDFLVVGSSALAVGGAVQVPSSCVDYMLEELLDALGVPK